MTASEILIVNNTGHDIALFHSAFMAVANGEALPEDIADIFTAERKEFPGTAYPVRVIVNFI